MKYLSRTLKVVGDKVDFKFHPRCTEVKSNHLCFADNVILCSKGGFKSVRLCFTPRLQALLRGFRFGSIKQSKSEIYSAGMKQDELERILNVSGFNVGRLPFRYLGVPICFKRILAKECTSLTENMTTRIRVWSSRNLSYQGRLIIVNVVLMSIHVCCAQNFLIPKKVVLKDIECICRSFCGGGTSSATNLER